jgi:hypothetical protein
MSRFRGLVYVKHGRVGSRSEGPDYYLQTYRADFLLRYQERHPWQPDYALEFYGRHMVEIEGTLVDAHTIKVASISDILSPMIPRPGEVAAHLGDPFALRYGQSVHLDDAKLKIEFHAVEQDSRCPVGVVCVWEGQCVVGLSPDQGQRGEPEVQPDRPRRPPRARSGGGLRVSRRAPRGRAGADKGSVAPWTRAVPAECRDQRARLSVGPRSAAPSQVGAALHLGIRTTCVGRRTPPAPCC